jgi:hypothetical protein
MQDDHGVCTAPITTRKSSSTGGAKASHRCQRNIIDPVTLALVLVDERAWTAMRRRWLVADIKASLMESRTMMSLEVTLLYRTGTGAEFRGTSGFRTCLEDKVYSVGTYNCRSRTVKTAQSIRGIAHRNNIASLVWSLTSPTW